MYKLTILFLFSLLGLYWSYKNKEITFDSENGEMLVKIGTIPNVRLDGPVHNQVMYYSKPKPAEGNDI